MTDCIAAKAAGTDKRLVHFDDNYLYENEKSTGTY
jgi:hypothetical protein